MGNKLNFNIGLIATVVAYIIGVFGIGMSTSSLIALWPAKILFTIIGICWLFGYANENGTLRQITLMLVHRFRRFPSLIPWVFFFIAGLICMTGASPYAPNAVLMPIIISVCLATNLSPLFGSMMVNVGSYLGAQVPWGQGASIARGVLEESVHAAEADAILWNGFWSCALFALVSGVVTFLVFRGWKAKITNMDIINQAGAHEHQAEADLCADTPPGGPDGGPLSGRQPGSPRAGRALPKTGHLPGLHGPGHCGGHPAPGRR